MNTEKNEAAPIEVPYDKLSAEVLEAVIESFVLREGTDYGDHEVSLHSKVAHVKRQLERGDAVILFDAVTESLSILPRRRTS